MSRLKQPNGDDYPEAAEKHMGDSRVLMARRRYDGAAYLAGYVVECALKTLIQLETGRVEYSHDLPRLCDRLDTLAAQVSSRTGRFYLGAQKSLRASNILNHWEPEQRYHAPGITAKDARVWRLEAESAYRQIIGQLSLAGVI